MAPVRYKKVRKLSITERAYIAGIIDGEGGICLTVKQKGATRHLSVSVSNTDIALLGYLKKTIGAGKLVSQRLYKPHHHPAYMYSVWNRQALRVLQQIVPYLRTYKLRRANLVLAQYLSVTPRNGKYNDALRRKREKFVNKFFSLLP